ncbi:MAG: hypothetical protein EOP54_19805, partial [Sphingobacteriales bacterium]
MRKKYLLLLMLCFYSLCILGNGVPPPANNYRWRNDNGNEKNATEYSSALLIPNKNIRLRFGFAATDAPLSVNARLYYSKNGGPKIQVTSSAEADFRFAASSFVTNGQATTVQMQPYDDNGNSIYQFTPGKVISAVVNGSVELPAGRFTELEYVIMPTVHAAPGSVYTFSTGINYSYVIGYPYLRTQTSYPNNPVDNGSNDITDFALDVYTANRPPEILKIIDNDLNTAAKFYTEELPSFSIITKDPTVVKSISITCADSAALFSPRTVEVRGSNSIGTAVLGSTYFDFSDNGQRMTLNFESKLNFTKYEITFNPRQKCENGNCLTQPLKITETELLRTPSVEIRSLTQMSMGLRNKITWRAAYEKDIQGFRLEKRLRAGNTIGAWQTIAEIPTNKNTDSLYSTYTVYDDN